MHLFRNVGEEITKSKYKAGEYRSKAKKYYKEKQYMDSLFLFNKVLKYYTNCIIYHKYNIYIYIYIHINTFIY